MENTEACFPESNDVLKAGDELYRTFIETSPDPIIIYGLKGDVIAVNRQAITTYGASCAADFLNEVKTVFDLLNDDGKALALASFQRTLIEGTPQRNEYLIKLRGGRTMIAELHSSIVRDATGAPRAFISVVRDITDRKKAEEILRENEEIFRSVVERSMMGIAVIDDFFRYTYVNELFCDVSGYKKDEILGRDFTFLLSEESKVIAAERNRRRRAGEEVPEQYEFCFLRKNGEKRLGEVRSSVYLDSTGKMKTIIQIIDITKRRQSEQEIHESREQLTQSEARYRNILESMEEAYCELDLGGNLTFFNSSTLSNLGYTRDEMMGMNYRQYVAPDHAPKVFRDYNQVFLTGRAIKGAEWVLKDKSGRVIPTEGSISLLRDAGGNPAGFKGVFRDITDRKRAEESLRESEEKYRGILENMDDAYYEVDLNGNYVFFNEAMMSKTGYTREEILNLNYRQLLCSETHQRVIDIFTEVYKTKQTISFLDYDINTKDGRKINVESWVGPVFGKKNYVVGFKGMARDVTERKRMEKLSRQSEEKFTNIFMTAPDCIAITRLADGYSIEVNRGFEEITGWKRHEVAGRSSFDVDFWVDRSDRDFMKRQLAAGSVIRNHEFRFRHKDGSIRFGTYSARPIQIEGEQCLVFIMQDITEKKLLALERLKLEERLKRTEKIEAIGTLAGGIAHDFNNILAAMMGYAEMIKFSTTDQKIGPYLQQILNACIRCRDLVTQILTFSRQRKQEKKPLSVTPIVKEALKLLRSSIPSSIEIRQQYRAPEDIVLADGTQIHQVLMNLCTNSVHAMRDREGVLEVVIGNREFSSDDRAQNPELREGSYLQLTVRDNGEGIDPAVKDRIFDPFFTTKRVGEGTGLGLSVVYGIVKDCEGILTVDSEIGKGTVFSIYLPLIALHEKHNLQETSDIQEGTGHILYVDDEEAIASVGHDLLTSIGYTVTTCTSSRDALEIFRQSPERFDLVITDMTMPNMTGANMAREMLKLQPEIPIILTTGFSEKIDEKEAKKIGIREFLLKPVTLNDLSLAVKNNLSKMV